MNEKTHILVVDDEPELRDMVEEYLSRQGFAVLTAEDGAAMHKVLAEYTVDLVLLDVNMPGEDGFTLARFLREHHQAGIIMVTAANHVVDRVVGLETGADDYITKPFDPRELLARIKSVLRRMVERPEAGSNSRTVPGGMRMDRRPLNLDSRQFFDPDGLEIPIAGMTYDSLQASMSTLYDPDLIKPKQSPGQSTRLFWSFLKSLLLLAAVGSALAFLMTIPPY